MSQNSSTSSPPPPSTLMSLVNDSPPPASSPPPPASSPPPPASSPPPPSSSPPPPASGSPQQSPPPSNDNSPPPPSNNMSPPHSPPPPHSGSSSKSPTPATSDYNDYLSRYTNILSDKIILIGVAAGAGFLLLIMVVFVISCSRRKKRKSRENMHYYSSRNNSNANNNNGYYNNSGNWQNAPRNSNDFRMPPSAHVSSEYDWPVKPPPPPPMMSTGEMNSSNFSSSGSQRFGQAPLRPQASLGYNQSSFSYEDLASATGGFDKNNLLGQGGFGYVHKGVLPNGKVVAVKSLKANSGQGEREFQAEVDIISRVHHRHLVSLVGYCIAGAQRMLVYEFVANDTLESYLHGDDKKGMDWSKRLNVAIGSAKGFAYLHEDCHPRIIHRDIKASNILLDENFDAKVADFGLAKLSSDTNTHVSTRIMGTFGYLAPEYAASGKLSEKSDVYSYGVVLLELITGKRPIDIHSDEDSLVDWARPILTSALEGECGFEELADPLLEGNYDHREMQTMIACAAACVRHSARRRPKMSQVVRALEGDGTLADLDDGVKTSRQGSTFSASSGSDYDSRRIRNPGMSSVEFSSKEYGTTSEYAHSSGGESSREINSTRRENMEQLA